jgi:predicted Zn-dependent protease
VLVYHQIAWNRIVAMLTFVVVAMAIHGHPLPVYSQQGGRNQLSPADAFQEMMERFANQAGTSVPILGKLTSEQQEQLDRIKVSPAEEKKFGQRILDAYVEQLKQANVTMTQQGEDVAYLRQLLKTLVPLMQNANRYKQFDVRCIESEETDAYSIPGGHLLVTRGLLESAVSEAAVVGVLAHELSHLDRGHQLIPLKQSKVANDPLDFQDRMMWIGLMVRPNRPEHESEADSDATRWMMKAGYDPRELARLLTVWNENRKRIAPWLPFVPGFVKSHPDAGRRAQDVLQVATKNLANFPDATYIGVENLRKRTPRSQKSFPGR